MYFYLLLAIFLIVVRTALVYGVQSWSQTQRASKTRIYDLPISSGQTQREAFKPLLGNCMDAVVIFIALNVGIFVLSPGTLWEPIVLIAAHVFLVEPIYYAYHRFLHSRWAYKNHHIRHHQSTVATPNTAFTFTWSERFSYSVLFSIPLIVASLLGVLSLMGLIIYLLIFDFLNAMGHLNFEIFPKKYARSRWRYLLYTPSFHAQHHSKFRKNYALFMPIYDYIFKTYEAQSEPVMLSALNHQPLKKIAAQIATDDTDDKEA